MNTKIKNAMSLIIIVILLTFIFFAFFVRVYEKVYTNRVLNSEYAVYPDDGINDSITPSSFSIPIDNSFYYDMATVRFDSDSICFVVLWANRENKSLINSLTWEIVLDNQVVITKEQNSKLRDRIYELRSY